MSDRAHRSKILFILVLVLPALAPLVSSADWLGELERERKKQVCANLYGELGLRASPLPETRITPEMKNERFLLPEQPGYRSDALYIGIANETGKLGYNWYLKVGGKRVGGWPFFRKPEVVNGRIGSKGVMFELPVPRETLAALEQRAKTGQVPRGATCLHSLCKLLEKEGVILHERDGEKRISAKVITANLVEGKVKIAGHDADPNTMRLLTTGDNELEHFLQQGISADADMKGELKFRAALVLVPTAAGAGVAAYYVLAK